MLLVARVLKPPRRERVSPDRTLHKRLALWGSLFTVSWAGSGLDGPTCPWPCWAGSLFGLSDPR
ncbi:hypothetical protein BKA80DRAFT_265434 [Phyllosticta citrichinensis]